MAGGALSPRIPGDPPRQGRRGFFHSLAFAFLFPCSSLSQTLFASYQILTNYFPFVSCQILSNYFPFVSRRNYPTIPDCVVSDFIQLLPVCIAPDIINISRFRTTGQCFYTGLCADSSGCPFAFEFIVRYFFLIEYYSCFDGFCFQTAAALGRGACGTGRGGLRVWCGSRFPHLWVFWLSCSTAPSGWSHFSCWSCTFLCNGATHGRSYFFVPGDHAFFEPGGLPFCRAV